jgi:hypothetical protein
MCNHPKPNQQAALVAMARDAIEAMRDGCDEALSEVAMLIREGQNATALDLIADVRAKLKHATAMVN